MSLGEAFIEVRADLRPFDRDLRRNTKPIVEAFEREVNQAVSKTMLTFGTQQGSKLGNQISRGLQKSLVNQFKSKNAFIVVASALAGALDDGISALPTEIKAAIVAGIILAIPALSAFLTGAIVAGIGGGLAITGIALASQFEDVEEVATTVGRRVREVFVASATSFGQATLNALALVDKRVQSLGPKLRKVFDVAADFVNPLTQGLLLGFEELIDSLGVSVEKMRPFVDELGAAIVVLFEDIGTAIEILTESGDDGVSALRDLASILGTLIVSVSVALKFFTNLYGVIRDIVDVIESLGGLSVPLILLAEFFNASDTRSNKIRGTITDNEDLADSFDGLISATEKERKELEKYSKALEDLSDSVKGQLDLNIDWEESIDRVAEALKENGKNLDIRTEKGRDNVREFANAIDIAETRTIDMLQRGELSNQQAIGFFNQQIDVLRALARQAGISDQKFQELFGRILDTSQLRLSSETMGINDLSVGLANASAQANTLRNRLLGAIRAAAAALSFLPGFGGIALSLGLISRFAEGDIVNRPTLGVFGEAGPEVIIPLTKPARAAQLMQESGLDRMVSGGNTEVLVFIGNEQLDSRMVKIVERNNSAQALALAYGGRNL